MEPWLIVAVVGGGFLGTEPAVFGHRERYPTERACLRSKPAIQASAEPQLRLILESFPNGKDVPISFECRKDGE